MTAALFAQRITELLSPACSSLAVEVVRETGSTNADLLARVLQLRRPLALAAEQQTAGRGRAGRSWLSAPGESLTFSLAWKFARPMQALVGLPLAVGVALAEALDEFGVPVQLKWPNDLLKDGDKLGGILIETAAAGNHEAGNWAVIGIGINLAMPAPLARQIGRPVAQLPRAVAEDRNRLLAALLSGLAAALHTFEQQGFAAFMARWNSRHAYAGQAVAVLDRGATLHEGVAIGVDADGRLLLESAAGPLAVIAGDVSLRIRGG